MLGKTCRCSHPCAWQEFHSSGCCRAALQTRSRRQGSCVTSSMQVHDVDQLAGVGGAPVYGLTLGVEGTAGPVGWPSYSSSLRLRSITQSWLLRTTHSSVWAVRGVQTSVNWRQDRLLRICAAPANSRRCFS